MFRNSIILARLAFMAFSIMTASFFLAYATLESRVTNIKQSVQPESMGIAQEQDYLIKSLVIKNCENREVLDKLFRIMVKNSDTMMRFKHYTQGHGANTPFCPECGDGKGDVLPEPEPEDYENLEESIEQAIRDSYELGESLERLHFGMTHQHICLQANLKIMRDKSKEVEK
jgi:hypothetical protein